MFLRELRPKKDGKEHSYWSLVETVRTAEGPRQRTLCYLGELNTSAQARWQKTIAVFNEQGESRQLKLFPAEVEPPDDDPNVARVLLNKVRLERARQFGQCYLALELWRRWDWIRSGKVCWTARQRMCRGRGWRRCWRSTGCARRAASWRSRSAGTRRRRSTICSPSRKAA